MVYFILHLKHLNAKQNYLTSSHFEDEKTEELNSAVS